MSDHATHREPVRQAMHLLLHAVAGGLLLLAGLAVGALPGIAVHWLPFRPPLLGAGAILILLGAVRADRRGARISRDFCVVSAAVVVAVAAVEVCLRAAGFDFRRQAARLQRTPPFYRKPTIPTGTVFFRREGPLVWNGPVIRRMLDCLGLDARQYADEPAITVKYDEFGFRNEPRPEAWEVAVAGDSFTELGHLPFAELFTTRLATSLGVRVLNLGVGNTGPLTQLSYLRDYGRSPATRQVVIVFFEGNDLADLAYENAAEKRFAATGRRELRAVRKQTSFLRAVGERIRADPGPPAPTEPAVEARLTLNTRRIPVTVGLGPVDRAELAVATLDALGNFLDQYRGLAAERGVGAWLAYLPCKRRVWHGHLEFTDQAPEVIRVWEPGDLPDLLNELCAARGIRFVDLTHALVAETVEAGELVYNPLYDSHLNARGSRVVAEELGRALSRD